MINELYNEDCLITMSKMRDSMVDLVITSPPYNMMLQVKHNKYVKRIGNSHKSNKYLSFNDGIKVNDFYELHSKILKELLRISKVVLYNFQIVSGSKEAFFKIIGDFNLSIKDIIIWDKDNCLPASRDKILNAGYEMILVLEGDNKLGRTINSAKFSRCQMDNILRIKRKKELIDGIKHGATFPEELCKILIEGFSNEGDLIYDPFGGTGTTVKVAKELGRNWIASELEEKYCDIIKKRINYGKNETI